MGLNSETRSTLSVLGIKTVLPSIIHCTNFSGSSTQLFIVANIGSHVLLNFFHQKFCIPSTPGADQFFLFFIVCFNNVNLNSTSSTSFTLILISSAIFSIHGSSGVCSFFSQILPQNSTNFSIFGSSPFLSLSSSNSVL